MSHPAPPCAGDMGLPAELGQGGDSGRHPVPPHADEYSGQLSDRADACPATPVAQKSGRPCPGQVSSSRQQKGKTGGRTPPRPSCPRLASGQRADHEPPLLPPGVSRSWQRRGLEADRGIPVSTTESACFGMVTAGLPRRVRCLVAAQAGHEAQSRTEACALANSGCFIACLIARTPPAGPREGKHGRCTVERTGRLPPLPCWSETITRWAYRGRGHPLPTQ